MLFFLEDISITYVLKRYYDKEEAIHIGLKEFVNFVGF